MADFPASDHCGDFETSPWTIQKVGKEDPLQKLRAGAHFLASSVSQQDTAEDRQSSAGTDSFAEAYEPLHTPSLDVRMDWTHRDRSATVPLMGKDASMRTWTSSPSVCSPIRSDEVGSQHHSEADDKAFAVHDSIRSKYMSRHIQAVPDVIDLVRSAKDLLNQANVLAEYFDIDLEEICNDPQVSPIKHTKIARDSESDTHGEAKDVRKSAKPQPRPRSLSSPASRSSLAKSGNVTSPANLSVKSGASPRVSASSALSKLQLSPRGKRNRSNVKGRVSFSTDSVVPSSP